MSTEGDAQIKEAQRTCEIHGVGTVLGDATKFPEHRSGEDWSTTTAIALLGIGGVLSYIYVYYTVAGYGLID
jgi:hypothetical protein